MRGPTIIDLFAGCGGMTQGFLDSNLAFQPLISVEWDLSAAATYASNFGESHTRCMDVAEFRDVPAADIVIGGPPCQGFSNLGPRDPMDPRNKLWNEFERVVLEANPQVFVLENVERFSRSSEFGLLMTALKTGSLRRWKDVEWGVLNSADYGAPQRRSRAIMIASRVGPVTLPVPTHAKAISPDREPWVTVATAIRGLPDVSDSSDLPGRTTNVFGQVVRGTYKMSELHFRRNPTARSLERYDCIPPGGGRFDLPRHLLSRCWANKPTGTTDVMGRMRWDAPSLTIRTEFFKPEKGQYLHPQWDLHDVDQRVNRVITHQEAALLQTFPADFVWCGSKTEIARQIGNAVPPVLASRIAGAVHSRLS